MPELNNRSGLLSRVLAVYGKDLRIELRDRAAFGGLVMFSLCSLVIVSVSFGQGDLESRLQAALLWIILLFSAMASAGHSFGREEESATAFYLRAYADPSAVLIGKLCFSVTLLLLLTISATPLFFVVTGGLPDSIGPLLLLVALGMLAIASATTLVSALVARAPARGVLLPVLGIPLLVIPLIALITATAKLLDNRPLTAWWGELQVLLAFVAVMLTASVLLFDFVWQEN